MSYFNQIEFDEPIDPGENPKPPKPITYDKEKIKAAIEKIEAELKKVRVGQSEYTHYATDPGRFGFPIVNTLKAFLTDPTEKCMAGVVQIATQDLGIAFAEFVRITLEETKEIINV